MNYYSVEDIKILLDKEVSVLSTHVTTDICNYIYKAIDRAKIFRRVNLGIIKTVCKYHGKIEAIKLVRSVADCGLREAKEYVDEHCNEEYNEWYRNNSKNPQP